MTYQDVVYDTSTEDPSGAGSISGGTFTGGGSAFNRIATSTVVSNSNGGFSFRLSSSYPSYCWCYLTTNSGSDQSSSKYAVYLSAATIKVTENGGSESDVGSFTSGDTLYLKMDSTSCSLFKNSETTSTHDFSTTTAVNLLPAVNCWTADTIQCQYDAGSAPAPSSSSLLLPPPIAWI